MHYVTKSPSTIHRLVSAPRHHFKKRQSNKMITFTRQPEADTCNQPSDSPSTTRGITDQQSGMFNLPEDLPTTSRSTHYNTRSSNKDATTVTRQPDTSEYINTQPSDFTSTTCSIIATTPSIQLTAVDFLTLQPKQKLNDSIIDAYLQLLVESLPNIYAFNCFFLKHSNVVDIII